MKKKRSRVDPFQDIFSTCYVKNRKQLFFYWLLYLAVIAGFLVPVFLGELRYQRGRLICYSLAAFSIMARQTVLFYRQEKAGKAALQNCKASGNIAAGVNIHSDFTQNSQELMSRFSDGAGGSCDLSFVQNKDRINRAAPAPLPHSIFSLKTGENENAHRK